MHIGGAYRACAIDRFAGRRRIGIACVQPGRHRGFELRVMKRMPAQAARGGGFGSVPQVLHSQPGEARLQPRVTRQDAAHRRAASGRVGESVEQIQHTAAFGEDPLARRMVCAQRGGGDGVAGQLFEMQFRVTAGQVDSIGCARCLIGQRRKKTEPGAKLLQQLQIGRIDKRKRGVACYGNVPAFE